MKKILIIHTAFIGDIILSTPLIKKIKAKYQDCSIDYLTTPAGTAVLKNNPNLDKIIAYDKKKSGKGIRGILKIVKELKKENYDIAVIPHRYLRSSLIVFLAGIKIRIGYNNSEGKVFLNKKIEYLKESHEVERLLNLIDLDGFEDKKLELYPSEQDKVKVENIWKKNELNNKKVIVIAPGTKWKTKMWPSEYYNELIQRLLINENLGIVIIGGQEEKELVMIKDKRVVDLRGETSLLEVAQVISKAEILVSNDSSPLHMAAAFDTFIIAIFGATVKELGFTPWTRKSIVIENKGLYCRPCGLHGGNSCPEKHFRCMLEIKSEEVYNEIIKRV